ILSPDSRNTLQAIWNSGAPGPTHSDRSGRQDWPEYCLFILAWFPPSLRRLPLVWSHNSLRAARSGAFCIPLFIPPAAVAPRAAAARPTVLAAITGSGLLED